MLIVTTNILGEAGMNKDAVFTATVLGATITCFLLGTFYNKIYIAGPSTGIYSFHNNVSYIISSWSYIGGRTGLAAVITGM